MNKKYIYSHRYFTFRYRQKVCCKPFQSLILLTILVEERLVLHTEALEMIWALRSTLTTLIPGIPGIKNYQQ